MTSLYSRSWAASRFRLLCLVERIIHLTSKAPSRWIVYIVLLYFLGVLTLGVLGFLASTSPPVKQEDVTDALYMALRLFTMESDIVGNMSGPLAWARFLAPFGLFVFFLLGLGVTFHSRMQRMLLAGLDGHDIVCGLGYAGRKYALDRLSTHENVHLVAIEPDESNLAVDEVRSKGGIVMIADATHPEVLAKAQAATASNLVALSGDDLRNLDIAGKAASLAAGLDGAGKQLRAYASVEDVSLVHTLRSLGSVQDGHTAPRYFNLHEWAARDLFETSMLLPEVVGHQSTTRLTVALVGFGPANQALALHLGRNAHFASSLKARLVVIGPDSTREMERFLWRFPGLKAKEVFDSVQVMEESPESPSVQAELRHVAADSRSRLVISVAEHDDEYATTRITLALYACLKDHPASVHARVWRNTGWLHQLPDSNRPCRVGIFGDLGSLGASDILGMGGEAMARAIHERYLAGLERRIPDKASHRDWDQLDETYRVASRRQAEHMLVKLRTYLSVLSLGACNPKWAEFGADQVEVLSRMEHDRWWAERLLDGWSYGPFEDKENKVSVCMIPWGELPEGNREYDRSMVRHLPELLKMYRERRMSLHE